MTTSQSATEELKGMDPLDTAWVRSQFPSLAQTEPYSATDGNYPNRY